MAYGTVGEHAKGCCGALPTIAHAVESRRPNNPLRDNQLKRKIERPVTSTKMHLTKPPCLPKDFGYSSPSVPHIGECIDERRGRNEETTTTHYLNGNWVPGSAPVTC
jgi:hypothetical protein